MFSIRRCNKNIFNIINNRKYVKFWIREKEVQIQDDILKIILCNFDYKPVNSNPKNYEECMEELIVRNL